MLFGRKNFFFLFGHLRDVLKPRICNRHILSLAYEAVFPVANLAFINNDS